MSDFFALLTKAGEARMANAAATGTQLSLVMAVGDGTGAGAQGTPVPDPARVGLVSERRRAPLNSLTVDPQNSSVIIAEQILPAEVGGWWIREMALFDDAGVMIAIANVPPTYKPQLSQGSGRTQVVRMHVVVSNTAVVSLKIDPNVFLASRAYVLEQIHLATRWTLLTAPGVLGVGDCYSLRAAGTYTLPASAALGDAITICKRHGLAPIINVADGSAINTAKGADPAVTLAGDSIYQFIFTDAGWEV